MKVFLFVCLLAVVVLSATLEDLTTESKCERSTVTGANGKKSVNLFCETNASLKKAINDTCMEFKYHKTVISPSPSPGTFSNYGVASCIRMRCNSLDRPIEADCLLTFGQDNLDVIEGRKSSVEF